MLEKGELRIRCAEETDLDFIYSCTSPKVRGDYQEFRFASWQTVTQSYEKDGFWSEETGGALILEAHNEPVGMFYVTFVREGLARIGLILLPENRGQGIGSAATTMITDYLVDNYPVVRIEADTDIGNEAARHALEAAGYVCEGTLRSYRYHHGYYHDSFLYSFVKE